ncbi:MAG TPA: hypothetical protein VK610_01425 [Rhodothermales bacterium]|nr:hypothetical protein [Rhodothermales bacterium]
MSARPPAGTALWTAAIGNTILALPAPVGLFFAVTVGRDDGLLGLGDSSLLLFIAGPILLGLILVAGYWWATLRGGPGPGLWPRLFWAFSLLYNLVATGTWGTLVARGSASRLLLLLLVWTVFMAVLSVQRLVKPEGAAAAPPELSPLPVPPLP